MDESKVLSYVIALMGVLWVVYRELMVRFDGKKDKEFEALVHKQKEDAALLTERNNQLYETIISNQKEFTASASKLASAVDKLSYTVETVEKQSSERHTGLNARIDDLQHEMHERLKILHGFEEQNSNYRHWNTNKITVLKYALETLDKDDNKLRDRLKGEWQAP